MSNARKIINTKAKIHPYEGRVGLVYPRVSSKKQEKEGSGLDSQEGRCIADLKSIGIPHEKTFPDTFSGGGDFMERPAMRNLLAYIDANPHKKFVVIFDDLKRFARDTVFHIKLRSVFKARDVTLRCLNYNFDDSPEGMFIETILAANAELERLQNKRQVVQKMKARLEQGYWPFRHRKGYNIVKDPRHGKIAVPDNKEAPLLKAALEGFASGIFVRRIDACKFLSKKGFWPNRSPEKYIDKFVGFARDPFFAGYVEYPQWEVRRCVGKHQAIISMETFEKNAKRLNAEIAGKRIRVDISRDFPLRGLLVCDFCSEHLTAARSKKGRFPYYLCHNKVCQNYGKCLRKIDVETRFDKLLKETTLKPKTEKLVEIAFDRIWKEEIEDHEKINETHALDKKALEKKVRDLTTLVVEAKTQVLRTIYETELENVAEELEQSKGVPAKKTDPQISYRTALNTATRFLKSPYFVWKELSVEEQHRLYYFLFEEKLRYNHLTGYRTDKTPQAVRLFEEFATNDSAYVDLGRIGLPFRQCE